MVKDGKDAFEWMKTTLAVKFAFSSRIHKWRSSSCGCFSACCRCHTSPDDWWISNSCRIIFKEIQSPEKRYVTFEDDCIYFGTPFQRYYWRSTCYPISDNKPLNSAIKSRRPAKTDRQLRQLKHLKIYYKCSESCKVRLRCHPRNSKKLRWITVVSILQQRPHLPARSRIFIFSNCVFLGQDIFDETWARILKFGLKNVFNAMKAK